MHDAVLAAPRGIGLLGLLHDHQSFLVEYIQFQAGRFEFNVWNTNLNYFKFLYVKSLFPKSLFCMCSGMLTHNLYNSHLDSNFKHKINLQITMFV